ncbi:MAG: DNA-binding response regulator [Gammaproteobacteria bacterium]|nr:MAG: DNA-binding response regulator [Gammaproteobacteria bacterium]
MIKVLVAEDQGLVCGAVSALLNLEPDIEVVAQAEDGQQALALLATQTVDLVLSDIEMPKVTGLELAEQIKQRYPGTRIVIMSTFSRTGYVRRALEIGVDGFILKEAPSEELVQALRKAMAGQKVISSELAFNAVGEPDPLSDKERKALRLASEGLKTREIAERLFLSEGTVRNYLSEAIGKLNAANRVDAARIARKKGWL